MIKHGFKEIYNLRPGIKGWEKEGFQIIKYSQRLNIVSANAYFRKLKFDIHYNHNNFKEIKWRQKLKSSQKCHTQLQT